MKLTRLHHEKNIRTDDVVPFLFSLNRDWANCWILLFHRDCQADRKGNSMKIEYQDIGPTAKIIITSTVFEFRRHVRVVDTVLMCTPGVIADRRGFFLMKTVISGRSKEMLRANKTAVREVNR